MASSPEALDANSTLLDKSISHTETSVQPDSAKQRPLHPSAPSETPSNSPEISSSGSSTLSPDSPHISLPSLPHQRTPTDSCLCRAGVVLLVPRIRDALAEQKADRVFKVTEDMIKGCQKIMQCPVSEVKCTDLICILSVLRHTDGCFELVARADLEDGSGMALGNHETSAFGRTGLRDIRVADLVRQACALLDSINASREKMSVNFEAYCRPNLARINLDYIRSVVEDFRNVLNSVTNVEG